MQTSHDAEKTIFQTIKKGKKEWGKSQNENNQCIKTANQVESRWQSRRTQSFHLSHVGHPSGHPPGTGGGLLTPKERGRSPMRPGRTLRKESGGGDVTGIPEAAGRGEGFAPIGRGPPIKWERGDRKRPLGMRDQRGKGASIFRLLRSRSAPLGVGAVSTLWVLSSSTSLAFSSHTGLEPKFRPLPRPLLAV